MMTMDQIVEEIRRQKQCGRTAQSDSERGAAATAIGKLVVKLRHEHNQTDDQIAAILKATE